MTALHGYAVKAAVEERTDGALILGPGTLYEAIHRMSGDGWIEEMETEGRRRVPHPQPLSTLHRVDVGFDPEGNSFGVSVPGMRYEWPRESDVFLREVDGASPISQVSTHHPHLGACCPTR